jgi:transposase
LSNHCAPEGAIPGHFGRFWHIRRMSGLGGDSGNAGSLLMASTMLLADRGYDDDWIRGLARQQGCVGQISRRKLAANYLAFVKLASIRIWLRSNESAP